MGQAARAYIEAEVPSWREVLREDLLPVWRAAVTARAAA
jgi:antirestriction protein ArdC